LDSKAKVKIGNLSRQGKARYLEPLKADDHDREWTAVLVPLGILDVRGERLSIYFGQSAETSDFVVDCLELWWQENQAIYPGLEELVIDLDTRRSHSQQPPSIYQKNGRICPKNAGANTAHLLPTLP
jgi:hypothetical protein